MKKISVLMIAVLMLSMMSVTALAHGGHGGHGGHSGRRQSTPQPRYENCTVDGCNALGLHEHNGTYYYCREHDARHGCERGRNR